MDIYPRVTKLLFKWFEKIREILRANGLPELGGDIPIKSIPKQIKQVEHEKNGLVSGYHGGECVIVRDGLVESKKENTREFTIKTVKYIGIMIDRDNYSRPMDLLLTLLHEFAHVVSRDIVVRDNVTKKWVFDDHNDEFYKSYARILHIANKTGMLILPKEKVGSYKPEQLKQFDALFSTSIKLSESTTPYFNKFLATYMKFIKTDNEKDKGGKNGKGLIFLQQLLK